jgi:hypothetical protein
MLNDFYCTCGFESPSELRAVEHAIQWHASDAERQDEDRLKRRIRTMIYSFDGQFSFDSQAA